MVTFDTSRLRYIDKWPYSPNTFSSSNSIQFTSNERRSALLTYKRFRNIDCISPKCPAGYAIKSALISLGRKTTLFKIALFLVLSSRKVAKLRSMDEVEYHTTEKKPDIAHLTLNVKKDRMLKSDVHVCY